MGLIYVNPEGPNGNPDPLAAARDIRETFRRMAMNDEETVALIAGGHTFGKTHGAGPEEYVGPEPEAAPLEEQGLGWKSTYGTGKGGDAITSGLEVTWTATPTTWDNSFLENLFGYEWELTKSPAGAHQWKPKDGAGAGTVPDAHDPSKTPRADDADDRPRAARRPGLRADLAALPREPGRVRGRLRAGLVQADPPRHGPDRALPRPGGPGRGAALAGPAPGGRRTSSSTPRTSPPSRARSSPRACGLPAGLDRVGVGLDVPRQRQARRRQRRAHPPRAAERLGGQRPRRAGDGAAHPGGHPAGLQRRPGRRQAGLARRPDRARPAAPRVEQAARDAGHDVEVPFTPGRADASQEQTDVESFAALEPSADGFRNYLGKGNRLPAEYLLVDKANLLTLSAPEMTVLVGGLRVLGANYQQSPLGVFTATPGSLTNDFFVNLLDLGTTWKPTSGGREHLRGPRRATGEVKWTGSRVDLVFGSNSELRALAEVYASDDAKEKFVTDFVAAWDKVMDLDRFDLADHDVQACRARLLRHSQKDEPLLAPRRQRPPATRSRRRRSGARWVTIHRPSTLRRPMVSRSRCSRIVLDRQPCTHRSNAERERDVGARP